MTAISAVFGRGGDLGRFSHTDEGRDPFEWLTSMIAQVAVVLVGFDYYFMMGVNFTLVLAVVLLPVWLPMLRRYPLSVWVVGLAPLALVWGYLLGVNSSIDHQVDPSNTKVFMGVVLGGVAAYVFVLWARTFVPLHRVTLLFGIGSLANAVLFGAGTWKFDLAIPITFIVLGIAGASKNRLLPAGLILVLGVYGVIQESRSYFAFCLIAAILTVWQLLKRPGGQVSTFRRWSPALLMAAVGLVIYFAASALLTAGYLGSDLQARSVAQVDATGSLLAGGRPEWAATRELVRTNPGGYGIGVVPTWDDLQAGKSGLASINIDAGGYTNNYMFGGAFELHSTMANFWVSCGIAGLALALLVVYCLVRNVSSLLASRSAATIVLFSTNLALWSMFFGPLYTDWLAISVALGLGMLTREQRGLDASPSHRQRSARP